MNMHTHSLNAEMVERYIFERYERFISERLPKASCWYIPNKEEYAYLISPRQKVWKKLVKECFDYVRMEPDNPYLYHTLAPTARGYNSNVFCICKRTEARISYYFYSRKDECFYLVEEMENLTKNARKPGIELILLCDRGMLGSKYGDFGYHLSLLDAGHQIELIRNFAMEHKKNGRVHYGQVIHEMSFLPDGILFPLVSIELSEFAVETEELFVPASGTENLCRTEKLCVRNLRADKYEGEEPDRLLERWIVALKRNTDFPYETLYDDDQTFQGLYKQAELRSSCQSVQGLSFLRSQMELSQVKDLVAFTSNMLREIQKSDWLSVRFLIAGEKDMEYRVTASQTESKEIHLSFNTVLHDSLDYLNVDHAAVIVYTAVKDEIRKAPESMFHYVMIKSGEIMQRLSLYLAGHGMAARPLKNMNEEFSRKMCEDTKEIATYMMVAGKSMNYSFQLPV